MPLTSSTGWSFDLKLNSTGFMYAAKTAQKWLESETDSYLDLFISGLARFEPKYRERFKSDEKHVGVINESGGKQVSKVSTSAAEQFIVSAAKSGLN